MSLRSLFYLVFGLSLGAMSLLRFVSFKVKSPSSFERKGGWALLLLSVLILGGVLRQTPAEASEKKATDRTATAGPSVTKPGRIRLKKTDPDGIALTVGSHGEDAKDVKTVEEKEDVSEEKDPVVRESRTVKKNKATAKKKKAPKVKTSKKKVSKKVSKKKPVQKTMSHKSSHKKVVAVPSLPHKISLPVVKERDGNAELSEAQTLLQKGNYAAALRHYDAVLERDSKNADGLAGKAYLLEESGVSSALPMLAQMAASNPASAPVQAAYARLLAKEDQVPASLDAWRKAVELDPANPNYRLSLAILYDRNGDGAEALHLYRQIQPPLPPEIQERVDFLSRE